MLKRLQDYLECPKLGFLLAAALSMGVFGSFGFSGWLYRDDAVYLYAGQQFAEGIAPYVSVFDHKTPLAPMLSGVCVFCGRLLGIDDVLAVRVGWWLMSGLTGGFLFLLGRSLYRNAFAGLLTVAVFTGFWSYGREAVSGPRAKLPFVLFEVVFFYAASRKSWALAGCAAALATWVWQPGIILVAAAITLPFLHGANGWADSLRGSLHALLGVLLPTLVLSAYFILQGAFWPLIDGSTAFNLTHLDRPPFALLEHLTAPVISFLKGYTLMAVPALLGLFYLLLHCHSAYHHSVQRVRDWPLWLPLCVTLPFTFLYTFMDFQGAADLYPFLPYMAIGAGGLLWRMSQGICSLQGIPGLRPKRVAAVLAAVVFLSSAAFYHAQKERGLPDQRVSAGRLIEQIGAESTIASIGLPELLVLTGKRNPNPYAFIIAGIDRKIMAEWPGGITGFVEQMAREDVKAIGVGPTVGEHSALLFDTLNLYYQKTRFGYFDVFVRIKVPPEPSDR
jgi:hypothetical protein